ncbi:Crp/Fnr family transcriptional regulator [Geodermatophilus sabuli]|uniref:cAMP-binding domain of CRP or a regulatory subunit of cAMP-dependent protein kinases n=1 Tax=Geodermatophilus sabuli TaxID=1564158 RepID=A0A285EBE4_9ACTN|nr:Crp/Fnr family transcriptional regulator [Geodermatophilus sabuli]MBB3085399.1 CRP-like cAMP-binding protein [Geodermatophilus sabuli]SNX96173.1 cAMP-binding domain of CRP or a regulatory subunit of cAMP-dependent protein kinases [Geodermatophilus sabuli]
MDAGLRAALAASSLAPLPVPVAQRLLTGARLVRIPAGSVTHREGETAEHLELVVDGLVRAFVTAPDGRTMTVRYCRRGALIGAVSLYATGFSMPAGIQAVVDADVLRMSPDVVRRAAAEDPRVADALLRELADRALGFIHEITGSAFTSVRQRVARHLLDLAAQQARVPGGTPPVLAVPVTQRQLAESVGTVREVVVRVLRDLRAAGVVRTHADHIDVVDPIRLSQEQGGTRVPARASR